MSEAKIELEKEFLVSAEMIYDAWLDPESIKKWMCPGEGMTVPSPVIDARVGGQFEFDMEVGAPEKIPHRGEYKKLERPHTIQFTWNSPNTDAKDTLVTIFIKETGENSCLLQLTHELFPSEKSLQDHKGGWTRILETLNEKAFS